MVVDFLSLVVACVLHQSLKCKSFKNIIEPGNFLFGTEPVEMFTKKMCVPIINIDI